MPKQYEAIRDRLIAEGMSRNQAQSHAARIYNAKHPSQPVTGSHSDKAKPARKDNKR